MSVSEIRSFYDKTVKDEIRRLDDSWLEYGVTLSWIERSLGKSSEILDLGGGPGRYALELAAAGHQVTLADLSQANLQAARKKARQTKTVLENVVQADARDLGCFPDECFDAVLCLGPIYHLVDDTDRTRAFREVMRVLRPEGVAFFGFLSRCAVVHYTAKYEPAALHTRKPLIDQVLTSGVLRPSQSAGFFTEARFDPPDTIAPALTAAGFSEVRVFGAEGGLAQSERKLKRLSAATKSEWLKLAFELSESPEGLFGSEHIVAICQRPANSGN